MADFIPLVAAGSATWGAGSSTGKKKKRHRLSNATASPPSGTPVGRQAAPTPQEGGRPFRRGPSGGGTGGSGGGSEAQKLKSRIRDFLEAHKNQPYIDIDGMATSLHTRYPEYARRKVRDFHRQVENTFERLQSEAVATLSQPTPAPLRPEDSAPPTAPPDSMDVGVSMSATLNGLYKGVVSAPPSPAPPRPVHDDITILDDEITVLDDDQLVMAASHSTARRKAGSSPLKRASAPTPARLKTESNIEEEAVEGAGSKSTRKVRRKEEPLKIGISPRTLADVGGVDAIIQDILQMTRHLKCPQFFRQLSVLPPRGCILHGPPGCGKSLVAEAISGELQIPMIRVSGTELVSGVSGESEAKIRDVFEQAGRHAPCLLFIDGIDVIAKKRENAQRDMEMRIVSQLLSSMDELNRQDQVAAAAAAATTTATTTANGSEPNQPPGDRGHVFVIGATSRLDTLDPALRIGERLEREIALGIPDEKARLHILTVMCQSFQLGDDFDLPLLARLTPGYVGSDLKGLIKAAASFAEDRHFKALAETYTSLYNLTNEPQMDREQLFQWCNESEAAKARLPELKITFSDFQAALKVVQPSALREGFATVPNVSFEDIGALDEIREELEMAVCAPVNDPEMIARLGMDGPSGVLLCGPPGCGKTLLAKAVANQAGINFISVKGPEIINMYVGESERAIRQVFQRARNSAPCVIFFDEIDSICPRRSGSDGGSGSNRVVNQLLTEMDGVEGRQGVYVMGATNRVDMLDPAILRPGRLTNHFFVDLPVTAGRVDILRKLTKNRTRPALADDVDFQVLADRTPGFSGADLGKLVLRAAHFRFKEYCQARKSGLLDGIKPEEITVASRHFHMALSVVKPSVSGLEKKKYDQMKRKYGSVGEDFPEPSPVQPLADPQLLGDSVMDTTATPVTTKGMFNRESTHVIPTIVEPSRLNGTTGNEDSIRTHQPIPL